MKSENEERLINIQGPSVLFGMAREIVRAITGRGPHPPVLLPTVSFYEQKPATAPESAAEARNDTVPAKRQRRPQALKKV